jgi:hypothetical protein
VKAGSRVRLPGAGIAVVLIGASLSACTEVEETQSSGYEPSKLEEVAGKDAKRVTFTAEGANRVRLRQAPIQADGGRKVAPYDALIYGPEGKTYVYVATGALSFERQEVAVDRIEGNRALLARGPRPGTQVVTSGATEVYGTELEISGG